VVFQKYHLCVILLLVLLTKIGKPGKNQMPSDRNELERQFWDTCEELHISDRTPLPIFITFTPFESDCLRALSAASYITKKNLYFLLAPCMISANAKPR